MLRRASPQSPWPSERQFRRGHRGRRSCCPSAARVASVRVRPDCSVMPTRRPRCRWRASIHAADLAGRSRADPGAGRRRQVRCFDGRRSCWGSTERIEGKPVEIGISVNEQLLGRAGEAGGYGCRGQCQDASVGVIAVGQVQIVGHHSWRRVCSHHTYFHSQIHRTGDGSQECSRSDASGRKVMQQRRKRGVDGAGDHPRHRWRTAVVPVLVGIGQAGDRTSEVRHLVAAPGHKAGVSTLARAGWIRSPRGCWAQHLVCAQEAIDIVRWRQRRMTHGAIGA